QLLLEHIEGTAAGVEHIVVEPQLIVRASTRSQDGA
ncbi:LacI family transcriptional regulator, partial [Streptomyces sp. SID7982]|nr:LacI family transcriptional regulator [Streptomyces sp. SID7982]